MEKTYDLIIIGGGPAGLAAAIYAGRSQRDTPVVEKGGYGGRVKDAGKSAIIQHHFQTAAGG